MGKIRLLIADDHPAFREGLCRLLEDEEDLECVGKSADGYETIKLTKEQLPDVVIIDVSMPKLNGIEAARQIKALYPAIAILMVSAFDYESYVLASLQAGASGYMSKSTPLSQLVSAIRLVHKGDSVLAPKATEGLLHRLSTSNGSIKIDADHLHPREIETLKLAAKGMSNKEIAKELIISERTVQTHFINIFRKLGVSSRTQAVLYALSKGWLTLDNSH